MELAGLIAWILFALVFAFLGMVLGATWKQMESEAKDAGLISDRERGRRRGNRRRRYHG